MHPFSFWPKHRNEKLRVHSVAVYQVTTAIIGTCRQRHLYTFAREITAASHSSVQIFCREISLMYVRSMGVSEGEGNEAQGNSYQPWNDNRSKTFGASSTGSLRSNLRNIILETLNHCRFTISYTSAVISWSSASAGRAQGRRTSAVTQGIVNNLHINTGWCFVILPLPRVGHCGRSAIFWRSCPGVLFSLK